MVASWAYEITEALMKPLLCEENSDLTSPTSHQIPDIHIVVSVVCDILKNIFLQNACSCCLILHFNSPCTPKALSPGVERQIIGVKISARVIQLWHAHCKRLDAAFKIHNSLV